MKTFGNLSVNIIPFNSLANPTPPPGSDYDQSTLGYEPDTALVVAGEINGDPANECYLNQGFQNNREGLTGFGLVGGYVGTVTNPLVIGLATNSQRRASPQDPNNWIAAINIEPGELEPGVSYYITLSVTGDPLILPDETIYMICATNEPWTTDNGWLWFGMSSAPYFGPFDVFNGTDWYVQPYDTMFYTFTLIEGPVCSEYKTVVDCVAAGCYWYNDSCHTSPQTVCESITIQTECITQGCYWYNNSCHTDPENGNGTCENYTTRSTCETAGCYWYAYPNPFGEPSCHEEEIYMKYLPFIIAGVGGIVILTAIARR